MEEIPAERAFRIRRCLADAGCTPEQIARFLALEQQQDRRAQYRLLARQKAALLEALHCQQYKIDCLDHMVYIMRRQDKQNR